MNNYNRIFFYLATTLAIVLPIPGRIAFGIFMLVHFNLTVACSTLILHGIKKIESQLLKIAIMAVQIVAVSIFYKLILTIICPIAALTFGYSIYLPAISSVVLVMISSLKFEDLKSDFVSKFKESIKISIFCFFIFFFKDFLGFSTLTFPFWQKIIVIKLPVVFESFPLISFIATIPGTIFFTALTFFFYVSFIKEDKND
ncbi:hypothetical protein [Treponema pectinovorum]|uniref:hypothetical protein n=1 Tax=Treponema pectinovorum TaxID=164 RepID=UPI0011C786B6|nr:hypothetical protein [Treponema pectinovorum]